MSLTQINVYRITHISNVPHILQHGITHRNSVNSNPDFLPIGDISLISTRTTKRVWIDNGDPFDFDAPQITLGDFIPFYFGVKMPMLYVVQHGGNFVVKPTAAEDIVYLVCAVNRLNSLDHDLYFSDGHATDNFTMFYDKSKINEIPSLVDWQAVKAPYWGGENLNVKRKKQAEFLVSYDVPADLIFGFGCYNESAKRKLLNYGVDEKKIKIIPGSYY